MSFRRANKSHKVPNVKLRPAQPSTSSKKSRRNSNNSPPLLARTRTEDSGFDSDQDTSFTDHVPRPFKGVVLCATGLDDKTSIFKQALELGALPLSDLTDKVTHLIAVESGSAKYNCAVETRLPIMHPSWITESHEIWLQGDDVDFEESVKNHRLPIFTGVTVTLSGVEPLERRTRINKLLTANGGTYVKNLERPVKVTHLLCGDECILRDDDPTGRKKSDKVKYAEKFNERREADIHIVWEEWLWDSLTFGGRREERAYRISKPKPEAKVIEKAATSPPPSPSSGAAPRSPSEVPPSSPTETPLPAPPNKPNRSAPRSNLEEAQDEEEMASVKRVPSVTLQIWGSLLKRRGFGVVQGKLTRSPTKGKSKSGSQGAPLIGGSEPASPLKARSRQLLVEPDPDTGEKEKRSALASFRRTVSQAAFAPTSNSKDGFAVTAKRPFQKAVASGSRSSGSLSGVPPPLEEPLEGLLDGDREDPMNGLEVGEEGHAEGGGVDGGEKKGLFSGLKFYVLGEAKSPSVRSAVEGAGGKILSSSSEDPHGEGDVDVDYIVVRLVSGSKLFREDQDTSQRPKYRTECWLERCLFEERICGLQEHISFAPLNIEIPIPGAESLSFSLSGLSQSESCWVKRLLRALGIPLAPNFSRHTTHLLCPTRTGMKFDKALEWCIPVVDTEWLRAVAETGILPLTPKSVSASQLQKEKPHSNGKGKERAVDTGAMDGVISDIRPEHAPQVDTDRQPSRHSSFPPDEDMFGQPCGLMSNRAASPAPHPPSSPPPSSLPPPPPDRPSSPSLALSYVDPPPELTSSAIQEEMRSLRIPSSNTPSPIKLPPPADPSSGVEETKVSRYSPAKISREASKVLQESITSLLGKRQGSEDDVGVNRGKRAKPTARTKDSLPALIPANGASGDMNLDGVPVEYSSVSSDGALRMVPMDEEGMDDGSGIGVTYEDPNQIKERKRLMELLETGKESWGAADEPQNVPPRQAGSRSRGRSRTGKKGVSKASSGSRSSRAAGF